ncbi:unnamed protein product, partial [Rotaria sordida]
MVEILNFLFVWHIWDKDRQAQRATLKHRSIYDYYDIPEETGCGAFDVVHRCMEKTTGKTCAAKFIPKLTSDDKATVRRKIEVMMELNHPKLSHLYGAFEEVEMVLVTEFVASEDLFDHIADPNFKTTKTEAFQYMRQISTKLNPNEVVKVSAATVGFVAPEIFDHDAVEFNRDMWSTGVLSYVIQDNSETMENIRRCDVCFPNEVFAGISDQGKDFTQNLLLKNR